MMTLMCHIFGARRLLIVRMDVRHIVPDMPSEPSRSATLSYHDNQGGDHASGSNTPSNHGEGFSDHSGSIPPFHSPNDHILDIEDVPHVSLEREDQPPPPPPQSSIVEGVLNHPSSYAADQVATTTSVVSNI